MHSKILGPNSNFQKSTLKFGDQICPEKGILGTELKKTIVEFEISTCEYLFERIFILNKALLSIATIFARNRYSREKK